MECKYTKYTIIEVVPIELKSYKTPIITIISGFLLWTWLLIYYIYINFKTAFSSTESLKKLYQNKYHSNKPHKEIDSSLDNSETEDMSFLLNINDNENVELIDIESTVFKGKKAYKIMKTLISEDLINACDIDKSKLKEIGSFALRKDIVYINLKNKEDERFICEKVFLTRSISEPVQMFIDFVTFKFIKKEK